MKRIASFLIDIDRRIIFILIAVAVFIPLIKPLGLPIKVSPEIKSIYDYMERLPHGSVFLLSFDFDPASKPELYPMAVALLRQAFRKDLRVIGMTLWVTGTGMAEKVISSVAKEMDKKNGIDYAFLGFTPGGSAVILNMGQDILNTFPTDHYGNKTSLLPVFKDITTLRDIAYVISLSAGTPGVEAWYVYGKDKYGFELGGGCTAVSAAGLYPLLQTGQINGLIGGLRGAAEYETIIKIKGSATAGMDAQSISHLTIIILIIMCNIFYLISGKK